MTMLETHVTEPLPISATRDAETDAFDRLFEAARVRLVRICSGLVGTDTAEDVVQDAYLRGRERFAQLREPDLFDAWLTRIAINLCMNRHRSGRRLRDLLSSLRAGPTLPGRDLGLREH